MNDKALHEIFLTTSGISTDTRSIKASSMFFALKGERFNGNQYSEEAIRSGASFAVIDEEKYRKDERFILVENVLHSLQDLASYHRHQLDIPFIGITGSNGKTSTKELIRDVLSQKFRVHATKGNLNNHIGVPLTLLEITPEHSLAIIEMGANHIGEIALLSSIASPDIGLITNIGKAHIGEFGGFENIIKGKTELYDHIRMVEGLVFVNGESDILMEQSDDLERVIYGQHSDSSVLTEIISSDTFLSLEWQGESIETHLIGEYNQSNINAAIALGNFFEIDSGDIIKAISLYDPDNNRSQLLERQDKRIIMDAYNANPTSMTAALQNLSKMKAEKKFAILGHMLELGGESPMEHHNLIELTRILGIPAVFIGSEFQKVKATTNELIFPDLAGAKDHIRSLNLTEHLILVKGSRGIQLEKVLDFL